MSAVRPAIECRFWIVLVISLMICSCGNGNGEKTARNRGNRIEPEGWDKLIRLENTHLMIDIPAVIIQVGRDDEHCLSVTILKSNIREGYEDEALRRNATARMIASIRSGQDTYTEMSDKDTFVRVRILRLDLEKKEAEIRIEARLVDTNTNNQYFEVNTTAHIEGEPFTRLIENMGT